MQKENVTQLCVILGGGGHARVLIDSLQMGGIAIPYAVLDPDHRRQGQALFGVPILGDDSLLPELVSQGVNCFAVGLGSTGDTRPRQRLFELGLSYLLKPLTIVHPASVCSKWANVGMGSQLLAGSVINAGATLGTNVVVNTGAVIEHDCIIDNHVHIATGAQLASTVHVGEGSHIGIGSSVRQCVQIGRNVIVGAGTVVIKDVPDNVVVVGVPARVLRNREL